jgi:hypothetical protein
MNTIEINTPQQITSKYITLSIIKWCKQGVASKDINLQLNFLCDKPEILFNKFQVIKNKIYFKYKLV